MKSARGSIWQSSRLPWPVFFVVLYFRGFNRALSAWGLCGLIAFNPYLYRTIYLSHRSKRLHSEIFIDERDISIRQRANLIAFHAFYAVCILVWAGLWATHREYAIFSIDRVIKLPLAALLLVIFVESLATVVQYGGEK